MTPTAPILCLKLIDEHSPFDWTEHQAELDDREHRLSGGQAEHSDDKHIPFAPVPRPRARRRGWSEGRQRAFIFALSRCGSVAPRRARVRL